MQVFVAVLIAVSGMPILLGGPQPGSLSESLPTLLVYVWAGVMVGGGALVVAAAAVRNPETALYFELAADAPLAIMLSTYAVGTLVAAGLHAAVAASLSLGLAAAFAARAVKVYRTIRELRTVLGRRK